MRWTAGLAALVCALACRQVVACDLAEGVLLSTNYELVQETTTIVLARAAQEIAPTDDLGHMRFAVIEDLRGNYPETDITLSGGTPFAGASSESDFSRARPGAYSGSCNAFDYRVGGLYVLFLEQRNGRWDLNRHHAFSRINEEVATSTSPWVQAVRAYSKVSDLGSYERSKLALRRLERRSENALAADIARHFASPTPAKSETDLRQLYASARHREERTQAMWALASKEGDEAASFFRRLLAGPLLPEWARDPTCSWVFQHGAAADLPRILRQVSGQRPGERELCLSALASLVSANDFNALRILLRTLDDHEASAFFSQADGLAEVHEARETVRRLLHGDYANQSTLAITLARWGDSQTLAWALAAVREPGDNRWAAGQALAVSPVPHAELAEIVDHGDVAIASILLSGLSGSKRDDRLELVEAVLARFPEDKSVLRIARGTLRTLEVQNVAGASSLLESLPGSDDGAY